MKSKTSCLYDKTNSIRFYEERYSSGYMDEWPLENKERTFEVIKKLGLPESGIAVDFGCGNGVFTDVMQQALPKWTIWGTDISSVAIENAKKRVSNCKFVLVSDKELSNQKFDFLITHHVLEHAHDIGEIWKNMNELMALSSNMLHISPCGNEGSFEHIICSLIKNGINESMENRFFFEDEGHVRRLTTNQACEMALKYGYHLAKDHYSNQYYGAIKWISLCGPKFIYTLTDISKAKNVACEQELRKIKNKLLLLSLLNRPFSLFLYKINKKFKKIKDYVLIAISLPFLLLSLPVYWCTNKMALKEWKDRKTDRNGSEMYLYFVRQIQKQHPL